MDTVKRYALLIGGGLAGVIILYLLLTLLVLNYRYEQAQQALTSADAAFQVASTDAVRNKAAIIDLTRENTLLLQDNNRLVTQLKKTNQEKLTLTAALSALHTQLEQQLAEATDEHTQNWRTDYVPVDAVQLLQRAATSALCAGNQDPLCTDAGSVAAVVSDNSTTASGGKVPASTAHASKLYE